MPAYRNIEVEDHGKQRWGKFFAKVTHMLKAINTETFLQYKIGSTSYMQEFVFKQLSQCRGNTSLTVITCVKVWMLSKLTLYQLAEHNTHCIELYIWVSCVCHVRVMCVSCEDHVRVMCVSCVVRVMWVSCACHVSVMWVLCECHVSVMWVLCECHVPVGAHCSCMIHLWTTTVTRKNWITFK